MSSNTRAEVNAGTLCGSRFVTSPARARISVPPFFGPLALADGPGVVVAGAHAETTVAMIRIATPAMFDRRNIYCPPRATRLRYGTTAVTRARPIERATAAGQ